MEPSSSSIAGPTGSIESSAALNGASASAAANWRLAEDLMAGWNAHDARAVAACYAPDFVGDDIALPTLQHGPEDIRRLTLYYLRAFPDLHVTIDGRAVDGEVVVLVWTLTGTHRGTFMNIPPTGRPTSVRGTTYLTIRDGLIRRATRIWDLAGLLRCMGLLPEL